jgi:RNA polymerase sigma-70 factor (ECF subfamily)
MGALALEAIASNSKVTAVPLRTENLEDLVLGIRDGNERALEQLYDATVGRLYALALAVLRHAEDAEEVVCATYAHAWTHCSGYDPGRGDVLGWLLMMCRSRSIDRLRQQRTTGVKVDVAALHDMHAADVDPDDFITQLQEHSRMRAALVKLSPERRRLISLAFFTGMTHAEIAAATGIPLGTVKSHVRRALQQLRESMESL